ncbi:MAG: polysaccharide biosynthesis protein [Syntrophobacteraceae bacterium]
MLSQIRNPRFYIIVFADAASFVLAIFAAYLLRFEFVLTARHLNEITRIIFWLIPLRLCIFYAFGLYKGMWRYFSLHDVWFLALATSLSSLLTVDIVFYVYLFEGFSRSVFFLDAIVTFIITGGYRVLIRALYRFNFDSISHPITRFARHIKTKAPKRVLIIGAGSSGEKILREIFDNPTIDYKVVGFLDDHPGKVGRALHGVPVLGPVDILPNIADQYKLDQVIISIPSATGPEMRRIVDICKSCGVSFKTLPAIGQILNDKVSIRALRDVNYEDLLGRHPVRLDATGIRGYLCGQKIMVTGAGGSIGSELCRQLIRFDPERIILVDAGESNLYSIQMELRHELNFDSFHTILATVQNQRLMEQVFRNYCPDVVFHAAAYKHVPLLETNPWEAVFNNVLGSRVVMQLAQKYKADRFVLVSTDKAVRPANVMGTSKRLAELILQSMQNGCTRFMAVRFGNVLASCGSVVPLFRNQIEHGGPVTVTHPEMTRYFMTIPEAAQLILQAGALGAGGEIFVLQMGTPVRVADMAADLIRLYGKEPGRDIEVIFTGLRPGEKLYEELITEGEDVTRTSHEKIMTLKYNGRWNWNGLSSQDNFRKWLDKGIGELYRTAESHDACAIRQKLKELVPEYMPQESDGVLKGVQLSKRISYIPAGLSNVNTCYAGGRTTIDNAIGGLDNCVAANHE